MTLDVLDSSLDRSILTFDTDSFMVGDRVWVNGVRPGYIQYIGDTDFAPGEWAGVVLDSPTGKNDGSLGGRRYFYCEPNRGVFARLWRLTRYPLVPEKYRSRTPDSGLYSPLASRYRSLSRASDVELDKTMMELEKITRELRSKSVSPPPLRRRLITTTTFSREGSPTRSMSSASSNSRVNFLSLPRPSKTVTVTTTTTSLDGRYSPGNLRVGDKVYVNAAKGLLHGRLRFLGYTDFAPGYWAGVELDEPLGKNDGSVGGKR